MTDRSHAFRRVSASAGRLLLKITAAVLGTIMITTGSANAAECAAAPVDCASLVQLGCMPSLGAGSVSASAASECDVQKSAYRSCLQDLVQRCDQGSQPGSQPRAAGASGGWGDREPAAPADCALGRWTGWVVEPGASSYSIELEVGSQNGEAFARTWYPELSCGGGGSAVAGSAPERLLMSETITQNRNACADGRFSLTCLGNERLLWRWYRNTGESFDAILTRR